MQTEKITVDQCKDTGLAIILIALLVAWAKQSTPLIAPAIVILILTMAAPKLLTPLGRLWFALSHWLGEFTTTVLLSIVFFVVATPIGLLRKWTGKDAMGLKQWKVGRQSVFIRRDHTATAADMEKPF